MTSVDGVSTWKSPLIFAPMSASHVPTLGYQRFLLPLQAVRVECLDSFQQPIPDCVATGFLRIGDDSRLGFYTCWHVVTGFDPHNLKIGLELPQRRYLRLLLQAVRGQLGSESIGSSQSLIVPLYANADSAIGPLQPLWDQADWHIPNTYLNTIGLYLPTCSDVIRLSLPESLSVSSHQVSNAYAVLPPNAELPAAGDKCLIVGYPYGYSAAGLTQPTPVVFTRFIASAHIAGPRRFEFFLDGYGAPGMSGGPVFIERDQTLYLLGTYTGDIFPDHATRRYEKTTALGTVADLRMTLWGDFPLVRTPSQSVGPLD